MGLPVAGTEAGVGRERALAGAPDDARGVARMSGPFLERLHKICAGAWGRLGAYTARARAEVVLQNFDHNV